jgi:hypothetical protein
MKSRSHPKATGSRNQLNPQAALAAKDTDRPKIMLVSRLLLNDQIWCQGDVVVVENGRSIYLTPRCQLRREPLLRFGDIPLTLY